jgi:hypothetical protein
MYKVDFRESKKIVGPKNPKIIGGEELRGSPPPPHGPPHPLIYIHMIDDLQCKFELDECALTYLVTIFARHFGQLLAAVVFIQYIIGLLL